MKLILDYNRRLKNSIIISSMGRSGSTLLLNIINHKNKYREIFEPFFLDKVAESKDFLYPQYIRPTRKEERYITQSRFIFSGKIRNPWTDRFNQKIFVKKRIIKEIRINLFLKWIHVNFSQIPIILLMRSPFATVHSWLNAGFGDGASARTRIFAQKDLMEDFIEPFAGKYLNIQNAFERLIFFWCIYYFVPLKQFNPNEIHISFYENYFLDPDQEIRKIFQFIGDSYSDDVYRIIKEPSATIRKESEIKKDKGDIINGWKKYVSNIQIKESKKIMSLFNMENIYSADSKPDINEVLKLMNKAI